MKWTVIAHYERGNTTIHQFATLTDAWEFLNTIMYKNLDCINAQIFAVK